MAAISTAITAGAALLGVGTSLYGLSQKKSGDEAAAAAEEPPSPDEAAAEEPPSLSLSPLSSAKASFGAKVIPGTNVPNPKIATKVSANMVFIFFCKNDI